MSDPTSRLRRTNSGPNPLQARVCVPVFFSLLKSFFFPPDIIFPRLSPAPSHIVGSKCCILLYPDRKRHCRNHVKNRVNNKTPRPYRCIRGNIIRVWYNLYGRRAQTFNFGTPETTRNHNSRGKLGRQYYRCRTNTRRRPRRILFYLYINKEREKLFPIPDVNTITEQVSVLSRFRQGHDFLHQRARPDLPFGTLQEHLNCIDNSITLPYTKNYTRRCRFCMRGDNQRKLSRGTGIRAGVRQNTAKKINERIK